MRTIADHLLLTSLLTVGVVVAVFVVIIVTRLSLEVAVLKRMVQANHDLIEQHWSTDMELLRARIKNGAGTP